MSGSGKVAPRTCDLSFPWDRRSHRWVCRATLIPKITTDILTLDSVPRDFQTIESRDAEMWNKGQSVQRRRTAHTAAGHGMLGMERWAWYDGLLSHLLTLPPCKVSWTWLVAGGRGQWPVGRGVQALVDEHDLPCTLVP